MKQADFETLNLTLEDKSLDFSLAKRLSEELAKSSLKEPMLIAWYDGKKREEHPSAPECQHQPGWLAYAYGHGGRVRVDVNKDEYSFIFSDTSSE